MLTLRIKNDGTGTEKTGNYDCTVGINGRELARCRIEGYAREYGWLTLLRWVANALTDLDSLKEKTDGR